ncbi:hypothetical protein LTR85_010332 [Meristemomyces frigidus]|nr:hypothetical protein LTR85_010332 [Meristemomyces frigidus]
MASTNTQLQQGVADNDDRTVVLERQRQSRARRRASIKQRKREVRRNERAAKALLAQEQHTPPDSDNTPSLPSTPAQSQEDTSADSPHATTDTELPRAVTHTSTQTRAQPPTKPSTTTTASTQTQTEVCTQLGTIYYIPSPEYHADREEMERHKSRADDLTRHVQELERQMASLQEQNLQLQMYQSHLHNLQGSSSAPHARVHVRFYEEKLAEGWRVGRKLYPSAERGDWGDGTAPAEDVPSWVSALRREVTHIVSPDAWRRIEEHAAGLDCEEELKRRWMSEVPEWNMPRRADEVEAEAEVEMEEIEAEAEVEVEMEDEIEEEWTEQDRGYTVRSRPHCHISRRSWIEQGMDRPVRTRGVRAA